ncbi:hypothetical protein S2E19_00205 [Bacillus mycoides]|uniref:Uncharacterized protein n=1 Tax=Bacillus mycoides TaxID=1405 RepID=A0A653NV06_BACMY|nr:hypothetical protein B4117_1230 [Bacillus mycoides]OSY10975.1 hypothetical protein S2E19_00205 [Bacillus mycoides]VXB21585.1 hypothetical protein BACI71_100447 [Bacillus mycoides]
MPIGLLRAVPLPSNFLLQPNFEADKQYITATNRTSILFSLYEPTQSTMSAKYYI